jgi:type I restriction enzyme S subunit
MLNDWSEVRLHQLVKVEHGFAFKGEFFSDVPFRDILVTPGNFRIGGGFKNDKPKYYRGIVPQEYVLSPGDLIITMTDLSKEGDTLGYPAIVPDIPGVRFLHNQRIGKVVKQCGANIDLQFLFYRLCARDYRHEVLASATGTTVKHTSPTRLGAFRFACPDDPGEQRAIAAVLGGLDHKIELNRRINTTLEELVTALFRSWFVDFDPVVSKAAGREPAHLQRDLAALFSGHFQDSKLGPIPRSWRVGTVGELGALARGSIDPGNFPTEIFDHYSIPAFDDDRWPTMERGANIKSNKYLVVNNNVLISKLNPETPRVWLPNTNADRRAVCSTEFLVTAPKAQATREFLFCLYSSEAFASSFATLVTGTSKSHQRVQPDALLTMDIVLPDDRLIPVFTKLAQPWLAQIVHNEFESRTLAALRNTLLPKLLSGDLRVKQAEKVIGAAM